MFSVIGLKLSMKYFPNKEYSPTALTVQPRVLLNSPSGFRAPSSRGGGSVSEDLHSTPSNSGSVAPGFTLFSELPQSFHKHESSVTQVE